MRPSIALNENRAFIQEAVGRYRTKNPRVFGSVSRGSDREGSDLDILVDAQPGATMFDLGGLQDELQERLGIKIDILTPSDLPEKFRAQVLSEAKPL
jgi:uncharacterized protein